MFPNKEKRKKNVRQVADRDRDRAPRKIDAINATKEQSFIIPDGQIEFSNREIFNGGDTGIFTAKDDSNLSSRISKKHKSFGRYSLFYDNVDLGSFLPAYVDPSAWSGDAPKRFSVAIKPLKNNAISIADGDTNDNIFRAVSFYDDNVYIMSGSDIFIVAEDIDINKWYRVELIYYEDSEHVFNLRNIDRGNTLFSVSFENTESSNVLPERIFVRSVGTSNGTIVGPDQNEETIQPLKGALDELVINKNPWYNQEQNIARISASTGWSFFEPSPGDMAYVNKEDHYVRFNDSKRWSIMESGRDAREHSVTNQDWNDAQSLDEGAVVQNDTLTIDTS